MTKSNQYTVIALLWAITANTTSSDSKHIATMFGILAVGFMLLAIIVYTKERPES